MRIRCIRLEEQGTIFFAALVKEDVIEAPPQARQAIANFEEHLHAPVVLCGDLSGKYFGRKDLAEFLARTLHPSRIRWGSVELAFPERRGG